MNYNKGDRIGAILRAKDGRCEFLGWGTFEGMEVPPEDIGGFNIGIENPKLKLDSGAIVWGCECWFGHESQIQAMLERYDDVVSVDIDEARKQSQGG